MVFMAKTVDISLEKVQQWFTDTWEKIISYFESITLYQQVAWGGVGLGLLLVIVALIVW